MNYYNEFDPKAAAWLRELINDKLIPKGDVDTRSITDVSDSELKGYTQHHFFAGIGGWSHALRLAGWPDDKPVWTGSCPCQPFSAAGKNKGKADDRHLWPHFYRLIRELKPNTIFGEQVEGAIKHGWLDDLQADLEKEGYAIGHCVLGAHSINSAHIRQRLYWVANTVNYSCERKVTGIHEEESGTKVEDRTNIIESGESSRASNNVLQMGDTSGTTSERVARGLPEKETGIRSQRRENGNVRVRYTDASETNGRIHDTESIRRAVCNTENERQTDGKIDASSNPNNSHNVESFILQSSDVKWLYCRDNKYRPIKPGIKPLVNGLPRGVVYCSDSVITPNETQEARVMRLKGYGNAIVPQVAAEFIKAFMSHETTT